MTRDWKDIASGAFFLFVGLTYGAITVSSLPIGETFKMGPGYFPLILSGLLALLGLVLAVRGIARNAPTMVLGPISWRAVALISASIALFAGSLRLLGLFPTVFLAVLLSTRAAPETGLMRGVAIALGVAVMTSAIFVLGIRLPIPFFGTWYIG